MAVLTSQEKGAIELVVVLSLGALATMQERGERFRGGWCWAPPESSELVTEHIYQ